MEKNDKIISVEYYSTLCNHFRRTLIPADVGWLWQMMYDLPDNPMIAEIGTSRGFSTFVMASALKTFGKRGTIYCIDPWTGTDTNEERRYWVEELKDPDSHYQEFVANAQRFGFWDMVTPIKLWSSDAIDRFEDQSLDMVFIDGNHSYESCLEDIVLWDKKLKVTGILCGHDWVMDSVKRAVIDFTNSRNYQIVAQFGNIWHIIRVDIEKACQENGSNFWDDDISFAYVDGMLNITKTEKEEDGGK